MLVVVKKIGKLFRLAEPKTRRIAKTHLGNAFDGGGHRGKAKAIRQAGYING